MYAPKSTTKMWQLKPRDDYAWPKVVTDCKIELKNPMKEDSRGCRGWPDVD